MNSTIPDRAGDFEGINVQGQTTVSGQAPLSASVARRRQLLLLRIAFVVSVVGVVALFAAGAPVIYDQLGVTCAGDECNPWQRSSIEGVSPEFYASFHVAREVGFVLAFCVIALFMVVRAGREPAVLLTAITFVLFGGASIPDTVTALAIGSSAWQLPAELFGMFGSILIIALLFGFPNWRPVPTWTKWLVVFWALFSVISYLGPESNPFYAPNDANFIVALLFVFTAIGMQIYRFRRVANGVQRQQTKWVIFGFAAAFAGLFISAFMFPMIGPDIIANRRLFALVGMTIASTFLLLIPLSVGFAMTRYRLWDVEIIANRTIVYVLVSAGTVLIYAVIVVGFRAFIPVDANTLFGIIAAAFVAVLFQPFRQRVQRTVNRLMYGERDEPYVALSNLGQRLSATIGPDEILPVIAENVGSALRLPYVAIALWQNGELEIASEHGIRSGRIKAWPLAYQHEPLGELRLSPRSVDEQFAASDIRLIEEFARQAGVAVHAARLHTELLRSRERLVAAREEERRRLRRDLHDGLGPQLASQTLTLDAVRSLINTDPVRADALLDQLREHMKSAVADIRRLVYGLRPPALDELGLSGALREHIRSYAHAGIDFEVTLVEPLAPLPAAVEVAAFRIAQEAMTNVVRHSRARDCLVELEINQAAHVLILTISDNGSGIADDHVIGVGIHSMRERATEIGGTLNVSQGNPGTVVQARIPIPEAQTSD